MISVDSVYQTVQRILNVEQRGQLPPEDFNRFAKLAQDELFNDLFFDRAHFNRSPKGTMEIRKENQEKIDVFIRHDNLTYNATTQRWDLHPDTYMLGNVYYDRADGTRVIVDNIKHKDSTYIMSSQLTCPTDNLPKYLRFGQDMQEGIGDIRILPSTIITNVSADYVKRPTSPRWEYLMVGDAVTPIYNGTTSVQFELHPAMEDDLVMKVLYYAGISTRQDDIAQYALRGIQQDQQIDKQ